MRYIRCDRCKRSNEDTSLEFEYLFRYSSLPRVNVVEYEEEGYISPEALWSGELCKDCLKEFFVWMEPKGQL